jgi:hypothetical protein
MTVDWLAKSGERVPAVLSVAMIAAGTAGCSDIIGNSPDFDRHRASRLVQPFDRPGIIFFDVAYSPDYPAGNAGADATREAWLVGWLRQRGLCPAGYEVLERRAFGPLEDNPAGYQQRTELRCRPPAP